MTRKHYNRATLGTSVIASELVQALQQQRRKLYSVANRTHDKGLAFAEKYGTDKVHQTTDEIFSDPNVDIVYVSTPYDTRINFLYRALANGKHVLCGKSITLNADELDEAIELAKESHVILTETMTTFHMPTYRKLSETIATGKPGELKLIQMNSGSHEEYDMINRSFNRQLAGGALLDVNACALSFVRWFMTSTSTQIASQVKLAPTGVGEQAGILLTDSQGEMVALALSLHIRQPKRGTIAYDKGYAELYEYPHGQKAVITYTEDGHQEVIEAENTALALSYEAAGMEGAVSGQEDAMHLDYTEDVMDIMTKLRKDWNLTYLEEGRQHTK